jgi:hypothetical protein
MGSPLVFLDLDAFRADSLRYDLGMQLVIAAPIWLHMKTHVVWKKCPGSVERDMLIVVC